MAFEGEYPPFSFDANGALLVTDIGSVPPPPGEYPPFLIDSDGAWEIIRE